MWAVWADTRWVLWWSTAETEPLGSRRNDSTTAICRLFSGVRRNRAVARPNSDDFLARYSYRSVMARETTRDCASRKWVRSPSSCSTLRKLRA